MADIQTSEVQIQDLEQVIPTPSDLVLISQNGLTRNATVEDIRAIADDFNGGTEKSLSAEKGKVLYDEIGDTNELRTDYKDDLVGAINENAALLSDIPNQTYITEKAKSSDVNSALELKANQSALDTTNNAVSQKADTSYVDDKFATLSSSAPKPVSLVANMTDTTKNYVYLGSESGYTSGNWYYWNGSEWLSGGAYQGTGVGDGSITHPKLDSYVYKLLSKINPRNLLSNPIMDSNLGGWYLSSSAYSDNLIDRVKTIAVSPGGTAYNIFDNFVAGQTYYITFKYYTDTDGIPPRIYALAYNGTTYASTPVSYTTACKTKAGTVNRITVALTTASSEITKYHIVIGNTNANGIIYFSQMSISTVKDDMKEFFKNEVDNRLYMDDYNIGGAYASSLLVDNTTDNVLQLTCTTSDSGVNAFRSVALDGTNNNSLSFNVKCVNNGATYPITLTGFFITYVGNTGTNHNCYATVFEDGIVKFEYNGNLAGVTKCNFGINSPAQNIILTLSNFKISEKKTVINPLLNKKISSNGDSICYGLGWTGGFTKLIAQKNYMGYENLAVSGATIATGTTDSNGNNRHWICDTVSNMDSNADYVLFEGGINDFWNSVPIGVITTDYTTTVDNTTFYGALEYMFRTAYSHFSIGTKMIYVIQHNATDIYYLSMGGQHYIQFHDAIRAVCKKYSIPVVDLFEEGQFNTYLDTYKVLTNNLDGVHPNKDGYEKYYVPKIEAKMKVV